MKEKSKKIVLEYDSRFKGFRVVETVNTVVVFPKDILSMSEVKNYIEYGLYEVVVKGKK